MPRILINGKPERACIFFGRFQPGDINIGNGWQQVQFSFTPLAPSRDATVHIRFGRKPGEVFLDDIRIVDEKTGQPVAATDSFEAGRPFLRRQLGRVA